MHIVTKVSHHTGFGVGFRGFVPFDWPHSEQDLGEGFKGFVPSDRAWTEYRRCEVGRKGGQIKPHTSITHLFFRGFYQVFARVLLG